MSTRVLSACGKDTRHAQYLGSGSMPMLDNTAKVDGKIKLCLQYLPSVTSEVMFRVWAGRPKIIGIFEGTGQCITKRVVIDCSTLVRPLRVGFDIDKD